MNTHVIALGDLEIVIDERDGLEAFFCSWSIAVSGVRLARGSCTGASRDVAVRQAVHDSVMVASGALRALGDECSIARLSSNGAESLICWEYVRFESLISVDGRRVIEHHADEFVDCICDSIRISGFLST